ncbi:hypothetical protein KIN20_035937 [Parelaphostrongylus tenuis]|uniref:Uncharacterized protein n=1 Tax=Parelaphostrongylus tenuis TaxID=148309 RepID=A0AAD5WKV3_PARTN|nr:hypothetical protein KIN20_035937 [Parelaphostrongylus tenuis]
MGKQRFDSEVAIFCRPQICDGIPDCFDAKDEEFCGYEQQRICAMFNQVTIPIQLYVLVVQIERYRVMDDLVKVL